MKWKMNKQIAFMAFSTMHMDKECFKHRILVWTRCSRTARRFAYQPHFYLNREATPRSFFFFLMCGFCVAVIIILEQMCAFLITAKQVAMRLLEPTINIINNIFCFRSVHFLSKLELCIAFTSNINNIIFQRQACKQFHGFPIQK